LIGASAGSITSSLLATNVNFSDTLELSDQYLRRYQVDKNPFGLAGIWGDLLHEWLHELIPSDITSTTLQNLHLHVTSSLTFQTLLLSNIQNKNDLINGILSSSHLPYFMNGKYSRKFYDQYYIDGSIRRYIASNPIPLPPDVATIYRIDFRNDPHYTSTKFPGKLVSRDRATEMMRCGYQYMESEHRQGKIPSVLELKEIS
jgi:hypothetical protein